MAGDQHSSNENGKHACVDLGNTRDFGEHAGGGGNKRGFGEHATEGGNKRDFGEYATKGMGVPLALNSH